MGNSNCCDCFRTGYQSVPEGSDHATDANERDSLLNNGKFNFNTSVFKGSLIDQKFTNTSTFDRRYIWVNYETRTLHMSQHESKEGRHKEASLTDIKSLDTNVPIKIKKKSDSEPEYPSDLYLTITFIRGGSIDLRFKSADERNSWYNTLTKLVAENRSNGFEP